MIIINNYFLLKCRMCFLHFEELFPNISPKLCNSSSTYFYNNMPLQQCIIITNLITNFLLNDVKFICIEQFDMICSLYVNPLCNDCNFTNGYFLLQGSIYPFIKISSSAAGYTWLDTTPISSPPKILKKRRSKALAKRIKLMP